MKTKFVAKFIHIKESLGLCEKTLYIQTTACHWCHLKEGKIIFWFRMFYKNVLAKRTFYPVLSTDHSPIFFSLSKNVDISRGKKVMEFFCAIL